MVALVEDLLHQEQQRVSVSLVVMLDLSEASNTINHGILLGCLAGLGGTVLWWLWSFLEDRISSSSCWPARFLEVLFHVSFVTEHETTT